MMDGTKDGKPSGEVSADMRASAAEAILTAIRQKQLVERPLEGAHDLRRLQKTHEYIFQDTGSGDLEKVLGGYKPGELRKESPYNKIRTLETVDGEFYVAYSKRDEAAMTRLNDALAECQPRNLRGLPVTEAAEQLAKLYAELDYVHPFGDGNSRTLRAFTRQLARDSGIDIQWEKLADTAIGRDRLRIARDKAVLEKVLPELEGNDRAFKSALITKGRYAKMQDLQDVLKIAVKPFDKSIERQPDMTESLAKVREHMLAKGWPAKQADKAIGQIQAKVNEPATPPVKGPER